MWEFIFNIFSFGVSAYALFFYSGKKTIDQWVLGLFALALMVLPFFLPEKEQVTDTLDAAWTLLIHFMWMPLTAMAAFWFLRTKAQSNPIIVGIGIASVVLITGMISLF